MSNKLSSGARVILGGLFGMMQPGKGHLTFNLRESKPAPWVECALHELIVAGLVSVEPFNDWGGLVFKPLVDCSEYFSWMGRGGRKAPEAKLSVTESLDSEADGRAFQRRFLAKTQLPND